MDRYRNGNETIQSGSPHDLVRLIALTAVGAKHRSHDAGRQQPQVSSCHELPLVAGHLERAMLPYAAHFEEL